MRALIFVALALVAAQAKENPPEKVPPKPAHAVAFDPVSPPGVAVPNVSLPATLSMPLGLPLIITAQANGKQVRWFCDSQDATIIPHANPNAPSGDQQAIFGASAVGTYKVYAYTAIGDVPSGVAVCVVTVAPAPTGPLKPGPIQQPIQSGGAGALPVPVLPTQGGQQGDNGGTMAPPKGGQPQFGNVICLLVYDASNPAEWLNDLRLSQKLRVYAATSGNRFVLLDANDPQVAANHYDTFIAKAGGVPAVLVMSADQATAGRVWGGQAYKLDNGTKDDDIIAIIKKATGQ